MDANESVVNLDEELGDTPIISHNSSHQNLLLAAVEHNNSSFVPSGAESGLSSPPVPSALDHQRKSGDALIQDVIEQLENQCSLRMDEIPNVSKSLQSNFSSKSSSLEPNVVTLPSASALFEEPKTSDFKTADFFHDEVKHAVEERRNSTWIPGIKTKETLSKLPQVDKRLCYTMPGVTLEDSMVLQ